MSISIGFGAICSLNVSCSQKLPKNQLKPPILAFKVIQGQLIQRKSKASVRLPISD